MCRRFVSTSASLGAHLVGMIDHISGGIVAAALFMGAATPLFYELGVEMTYPEPEVISNSIVTLWNNAGGMVFLFTLPGLLNSQVLNLVCLGAGSVCLLCVAVFDCGTGAHEVYRRQEAEQKSESRWDD